MSNTVQPCGLCLNCRNHAPGLCLRQRSAFAGALADRPTAASRDRRREIAPAVRHCGANGGSVRSVGGGDGWNRRARRFGDIEV